MEQKTELNGYAMKQAITLLQNTCHGMARDSGWWTDLKTGERTDTPLFGLHGDRASLKINVPEKLMLIVSELGEGMEAFRKGLKDDHLPHRMGLEVELADAVIRIADLADGIGLDLAGAIVEKLQYNQQRADHRLENRKASGGKSF